MKTKKNWFPILLSFFVILFFNLQLMGVPYPVKENKSIDFEKLSKKEIEKKLGRKLKWKEKIAFRVFSKRINKAKEVINKSTAKIKLLGGGIVMGQITKVQKDQIYITNYVKRLSSLMEIKMERGKEIVILVKRIKKIKLKQKSKRKIKNLKRKELLDF